MNDQNPYTSPAASLETAQQETYQPEIFSFKGRIGRLRYFAYGMGVYLILMVIAGVLGGTGAFLGESSMSIPVLVVMGVVYFAIIVYSIGLGKRRLNDLNRSGWWLFAFIVPILNFIMMIYIMFFRGTRGSNNFGPEPCKNSLGVKILGWMMPVVFLAGILAAIAIPAYQDYVTRAAISQTQQ